MHILSSKHILFKTYTYCKMMQLWHHNMCTIWKIFLCLMSHLKNEKFVLETATYSSSALFAFKYKMANSSCRISRDEAPIPRYLKCSWAYHGFKYSLFLKYHNNFSLIKTFFDDNWVILLKCSSLNSVKYLLGCGNLNYSSVVLKLIYHKEFSYLRERILRKYSTSIGKFLLKHSLTYN